MKHWLLIVFGVGGWLCFFSELTIEKIKPEPKLEEAIPLDSRNANYKINNDFNTPEIYEHRTTVGMPCVTAKLGNNGVSTTCDWNWKDRKETNEHHP